MNESDKQAYREYERDRNYAALTCILGGLAMYGGDRIPGGPDSIRHLGDALVYGGAIIVFKGAWESLRASLAQDALKKKSGNPDN